jgi:hypothetical protein
MKPAAAPIVIFERMLAVPLGPNAVLETLLENRSPAPDFPGCNRTTTTRITHERINSPYKRYASKSVSPNARENRGKG